MRRHFHVFPLVRVPKNKNADRGSRLVSVSLNNKQIYFLETYFAPTEFTECSGPHECGANSCNTQYVIHDSNNHYIFIKLQHHP